MQQSLFGEQFGRWKVKGTGEKESHLLCECSCGTVKEVYKASLVKGKSKSCGCAFKKHGETKTRLFRIWSRMKERCYNRNHQAYPSYGGRGITVCEEWSSSFLSFKECVGEPPTTKHQIDRIDNNSGYMPGNVRWATPKQQGNNRRTNIVLAYKGESRTVSQWAEAIGVKRATLYSRVNKGWPVDKILHTGTVPRESRGKGYECLPEKLNYQPPNVKTNWRERVTHVESAR